MKDPYAAWIEAEYPEFHADTLKAEKEAQRKERLKQFKSELEAERQAQLKELEQPIEWDSSAVGISDKPNDRFIPRQLPETKSSVVSIDDKSNGEETERNSELHALIWRVYQHLLRSDKRTKAPKVWSELRYRRNQYEGHEIIKTMDANIIKWESSYGNAQEFSISSISSTLCRLKKNPPF